MPEDIKQSESLSPEIEEVIQILVSAIRIIKLYPHNNPVYSQTVNKAHGALAHFLETHSQCEIGVQKTFLTYLNTPIGKDPQINKSLSQDLFMKGVRNISFIGGLTEDEILHFFQILAMSKEQIAMQSGVSSILLEKGISHIKVLESELDGVITSSPDGAEKADDPRTANSPSSGLKSKTSSGRILVMEDLLADPIEFGSEMIELAKKTRKDSETMEERLMALYREAGQKIQEEAPEQSDACFLALSRSILSLAKNYRESLIAGILYAGIDSKNLDNFKTEIEGQLPAKCHEIITGRFLQAWNAQHIADLLKNSIGKQTNYPADNSSLFAPPIPADPELVLQHMSEYTAEEKEFLKSFCRTDNDAEITERALRILIALVPLVKNPRHDEPNQVEVKMFAGIVSQLEEMLTYFLQKKDFEKVSLIITTLNSSVEPVFQNRLSEALKKTSSKELIALIITNLHNYQKDSAAYLSAYSFLKSAEKEAAEVLLEMMANQSNSNSMIFIQDLLKDIGKNQLSLWGEYLDDDRSLFVSKIISMLGEIKSDQSIFLLQKTIHNRNSRIRQETIRTLISIGGKQAASVLTKFIKDEDEAVRLAAVRGMAAIKEIGADDIKPLITFLSDRPLNDAELPLTLEAIKTLGEIGSSASLVVLENFTKLKWWKSWKLQRELKHAAGQAINDINRRKGNVSGKRQ